MEQTELTPEAKQAICDAVREIASPVPKSWESTVAFVGLIIYVVTRPPVISSRTPYLLSRSVPAMLADFVILAACAGCGLSAARNARRTGRLTGAIALIASTIVICDWVHLLVNLKVRIWG